MEEVQLVSEKSRILVVDDDEITRAILENMFADYYEVDLASNGRECLEIIRRSPNRYAALLLDVMMPEMTGIEVLRELEPTGFTSSTPVFLITAEKGGAHTEEAFGLGVMDYISKPIRHYVVRRRVFSVVELFEARKSLSGTVESQRVQLLERAKQVIELSRGMIETLAAAIEFRDCESGQHVRRIQDITRLLLAETRLGDGLSEDDVEDIALASALHDVGKIAIPDGILNKPARLTDEEFEIMKGHTVQGARLLRSIPQLHDLSLYSYAVDIALHHHERWDGRGYPDGLVGNEISRWAQAVSVADVYDALVSKRVYKEAHSHRTAVRMIIDGECGAFGPELVEALLAAEPKLEGLYKR